MERIMTDRKDFQGSGSAAGNDALYRAVDRWGPEITDWRDRLMVRQAREALLSDRKFRAYRDGAIAMEAEIDGAAAALDERIATSGALARITRNVQRATATKPIHWARRIAAVAAVLVASAALGGVYESRSGTLAPSAETQVVQLDPLVFGMSGPDF
jgi:hypothetical protein